MYCRRAADAVREDVGVSVYSIIVPPESAGDLPLSARDLPLPLHPEHASGRLHTNPKSTIAATNMPEVAYLLKMVNALKWFVENVDKLQKA